MPSLTSLLGNPLADVLQAANEIIGRFVTDPNAKLQASQELVRLQEQYSEKVLAADIELARSQQAVLVAEATSQSWLTRNWRPITMMVFVFIVAYNYVLAPIFSLRYLPIPPDLWELLKLGIGGYIIGRSVEKVAPTVAAAMAAKAPADKSTDITALVNANGAQ